MTKIKSGKNASKKDAIIIKASMFFRKQGFNATSMRGLADALGIEAPSLYNHIGSKNELLQEICFNIADLFTSHLNKIESSSENNITKLENIIRFHIRTMSEKFNEVYVANHEWKYLKPSYLGNFLHQRRSYEKRLTAIIKKGINKKEFKNINPYITVLTILSAVRGLEFWYRHKKNMSIKILENDMVNLLLKGIVK